VKQMIPFHLPCCILFDKSDSEWLDTNLHKHVMCPLTTGIDNYLLSCGTLRLQLKQWDQQLQQYTSNSLQNLWRIGSFQPTYLWLLGYTRLCCWY
jgi:hypothetical protein